MWCLDNGHGKLTKGKRSPLFDDGETQFLEYEFNRDIVQRIAAQLKEKGIQYFEVAPDVEEIDNTLSERVERVNNYESDLPKLLVSVHCNAGPSRSREDWASDDFSGMETWFHFGSKRGEQLASIFQNHLIKATGWKDRGIKSRESNQFFILRQSEMPAILTENGVYNNKTQALELMKDSVRQTIADAHVAAIEEIEERGLRNEE
jgi:N-acetylmuramoyl-L-alanine amidase